MLPVTNITSIVFVYTQFVQHGDIIPNKTAEQQWCRRFQKRELLQGEFSSLKQNFIRFGSDSTFG